MLKAVLFQVSSGFLGQDLKSSYIFGKIQNVGGTELLEEKKLVFHWRKISYFVSTLYFSTTFAFYILLYDVDMNW